MCRPYSWKQLEELALLPVGCGEFSSLYIMAFHNFFFYISVDKAERGLIFCEEIIFFVPLGDQNIRFSNDFQNTVQWACFAAYYSWGFTWRFCFRSWYLSGYLKKGTPIEDNRIDVVTFGLHLLYLSNVHTFCAGHVVDHAFVSGAERKQSRRSPNKWTETKMQCEQPLTLPNSPTDMVGRKAFVRPLAAMATPYHYKTYRLHRKYRKPQWGDRGNSIKPCGRYYIAQVVEK